MPLVNQLAAKDCRGHAKRKALGQHPSKARLAQSAKRKALNLVVVGSSPMVGAQHRRKEKAKERKHPNVCDNAVTLLHHDVARFPKTRRSCCWTFKVSESTAPGHSNVAHIVQCLGCGVVAAKAQDRFLVWTFCWNAFPYVLWQRSALFVQALQTKCPGRRQTRKLRA